MEEYDIIELHGENSTIRLHVPKTEATEEDINDLHKAVAEVIININKKDTCQ